MKKRVKKSVTHQDIGGKIFEIDEQITEILTNEECLKHNNFATLNFILRRPDFDINFPYKLYYGHVGDLGYVVAEDELEEV